MSTKRTFLPLSRHAYYWKFSTLQCFVGKCAQLDTKYAHVFETESVQIFDKDDCCDIASDRFEKL